MAGFTPATGRVVGFNSSIVNDKKRDDKSVSNTNNDNDSDDHVNVLENDEIADSDSSSTDYDNPYHETALDLYTRCTRRRARRLAGISSSDDSSSGCSSDDDDGSISTVDDVDNEKDRSLYIGGRTNEDGVASSSFETTKRKREMERAIRSAERPLKKWLSSYPLVAARSCLSSMPVVVDVVAAAMDGSVGGRRTSRLHPTATSPPPPSFPPRVEETKRLRRILRRLRRKQTEFRVKFGNVSSSTGVQQMSNQDPSCEMAVD